MPEEIISGNPKVNRGRLWAYLPFYEMCSLHYHDLIFKPKRAEGSRNHDPLASPSPVSVVAILQLLPKPTRSSPAVLLFSPRFLEAPLLFSVMPMVSQTRASCSFPSQLPPEPESWRLPNAHSCPPTQL